MCERGLRLPMLNETETERKLRLMVRKTKQEKKKLYNVIFGCYALNLKHNVLTVDWQICFLQIEMKKVGKKLVNRNEHYLQLLSEVSVIQRNKCQTNFCSTVNSSQISTWNEAGREVFKGAQVVFKSDCNGEMTVTHRRRHKTHLKYSRKPTARAPHISTQSISTLLSRAISVHCAMRRPAWGGISPTEGRGLYKL